ncbi:cysteine desulfurase family protein [Catonella morbi ATCC 51271]|uniref:cysteine desulfurase n=1 Tax=Catonella morbi ATCC 51271 TaxID=592026 RepID=V2Y195_9FIRM|nr:aminotransferase class V-fold PLP-dependent enzyme [Catonella morbi]ESL01837.1 cysteine desulfurase family protein [Catonella morbi ATCC 51271]
MIYLDNAATTRVKPKEVVEAVAEALTTLGNAERGTHSASLGASRTVFSTRMKLAKFFNAEGPSNIVFTMNATESLNIAIKGILEKGDAVITTCLEHNSVLRPLYQLRDEGVELSFVSADKLGRPNYEEFENLIKPNTKAIISTAGSNLTGNLVDIKRVGEIAKKHGLIFVVDASQTAGVFPIDVKVLNIDILCFTGHKGLLGPQGTGGMYVREGVEVKPYLSGGTGVQTYNEHQPVEMPTRLEAGTLNGHGLAGLDAAIDYINEYGMQTIHDKEMSLMWRFYNGVKDIEGVKIYGDFDIKDRCPIVSINLSDYESGAVSDELANRFEIATRPGGHCAPLMHKALGTVDQGAVRFSFSHFNTEEEVDTAINAVRTLIEE